MSEVTTTSQHALRETLMAVAPGTELRDGLERILRGRTGALVVLDFNPTVAAMCSGGFELNAPFSATRLRELAKMDGAVVLDRATSTIVRAGVQLLPDPRVPTSESGTRHRTAQRVANQTGFPVVAVSQSMNTVAIFVPGLRHVLESPEELASRTNQALTTLERYRNRLDQVSATLSSLEIEDRVTVRDVATVAGRLEMVRRIRDEGQGLLRELGDRGRLLRLQFEELIVGVDDLVRLLALDYFPDGGPAAFARLASATPAELVDSPAVAVALGLVTDLDEVDRPLSPRGYRLLSQVPRLSGQVASEAVDKFGSLQHLLAASVDELTEVPGLDQAQARSTRETLSRIAETSMLG